MVMAKRSAASKPVWVDADDAPEITEEWLDGAEIRHGNRLIKRGRHPIPWPKQLVSIRLDQEVLDRLRELGPGWQTKANAALRAFVETLPKRDEPADKG
jgi:uncharacterized protein (DUF4415 family)